MLKSVEVKVETKEIRLYFEPKTKGKFRFKKVQNPNNPYTELLRNEEINETNEWYLEWMITYFVYTKDDAKVKDLLINHPVKLNSKKRVIYPYELPGLYLKAIEAKLLSQQDHDSLISWICNARETFHDKYIVLSNECKTVKLNNMTFKQYNIKIPLLVLENSDRTWIEIMLQKQQYAYSVQPFVFLCIPHNAFNKDGNRLIWTIGESNVEVILNLFKVFSSTSKSHRKDVCNILETLNEKV